jgi:dipeptidyl aminopeptidase/acylaminoacyl peptidase
MRLARIINRLPCSLTVRGAQTWAKDSKNIVFIVTDDRTRYLANININSGKITTINKGDYVFNDIAPIFRVIGWYKKQIRIRPAELFALEDKKLRRLTFHHDEWLNTVQLAYAKGFESTSADGAKVSGIVLTPDSVPNKKYPLILFIHGGPVGQDEFGFDATRQTLAAAGYAVAAVNYRGSNGRGLIIVKPYMPIGVIKKLKICLARLTNWKN